jgi:uncharacterized protein YceK
MFINFRIIKRAFFVFALSFLLNGCGTIMAHRNGIDVSYAGVQHDINTMRKSPETFPFYCLDLPVSLAADTLLLPITLSIGPSF